MSTRPSRSSDYERRFPGLATLARDYLHLDWDFEYDTAQDAVLAFVKERDDALVSCLSGVEALLAECPDEAARDQELDGLGFGYAPRPGRLDAFLVWTRETLRSRLSAAAG